jgi:hypothetical protein
MSGFFGGGGGGAIDADGTINVGELTRAGNLAIEATGVGSGLDLNANGDVTIASSTGTLEFNGAADVLLYAAQGDVEILSSTGAVDIGGLNGVDVTGDLAVGGVLLIDTGGIMPLSDNDKYNGVPGASWRETSSKYFRAGTYEAVGAGVVSFVQAEIILVNSTTTPYTLTLPPVSFAGAGRSFLFRCDSSVTNASRVTIAADGAETIDGAANLVLSTPYTVCRLTCTGTEWAVTDWVMGQPSAYTTSGSTFSTNTTITAYVEQPAPRVIRCTVRLAFSGAPDTAAFSIDAAPPGFTIDETIALYPSPFVGEAVLEDSGSGYLMGRTQYLSASNTVRALINDDAAASTFYLVPVTQAAPIPIANGDSLLFDHTLRVQ